MSDELNDAIEQAAVDGIQSASGDSGSVTKVPLKDQIEAAKFLQGQQAVTQPHRGLRFTKLIPPGGG